MSKLTKSGVDWADYRWSPMIGCRHNCQRATIGYDCYARTLNKRFKFVEDFAKPQIFYDKMTAPAQTSKPGIVFVAPMSDIFGQWWDFMEIFAVLQAIRQAPQHTFVLLTKNPFRIWEFKNLIPKNVMLGTTINKDNPANKYRLDQIFYFKGFRRIFLSIEPIMSPVTGLFREGPNPTDFDLLIVGANTTPGSRAPQRGWIDDIQHPNIFYKQNLRDHYPDLPEGNKNQINKLFPYEKSH